MTKVVYTATNKETKQVYVGITSSSIEDRKKDHIEKSKSGKKGKFYEAIGTYSPNAFIWTEIDTASTTDELAKKEKYYIFKYNSKIEGYNSDEGGGIQKTVYQYDVITGELIDKHSCLTIAGEVIGLNKQDLSKVCLSVNKVSHGFYWSYDYVDKFDPLKDARKKIVFQFALDGEFINEFNSVSEASNFTGCNKSGIAKVCRGKRKSCGGFYWKFKE